MTKIVNDLDSVWIGGQKFTGIGYQGLISVNTVTYVESPTRSSGGSIDNINDYETFVVPRVSLTFPMISIEDYQRLCRVVNISNEFPVTYWDKEIGDFVTHNMYCEPEEMKKLFNIGFRVVGVLDFKISFIGTLNNLKECSVSFFMNSGVSDGTILSSSSCVWGSTLEILSQAQLETVITNKGLSVPSGKRFVYWNTKRDGSGFTYYGGTSPRIFESANLYAIWE